jgi:uncharacterized protein YlbG (UPF0298 family)
MEFVLKIMFVRIRYAHRLSKFSDLFLEEKEKKKNVEAILFYVEVFEFVKDSELWHVDELERSLCNVRSKA